MTVKALLESDGASMTKTSIVLLGVSLSSGIGGTLLLMANLIVWAVLTFWVGSLAAFAGFVLIVWALRPSRDDMGDDDEMLADTADTELPAKA